MCGATAVDALDAISIVSRCPLPICQFADLFRYTTMDSRTPWRGDGPHIRALGRQTSHNW